MFTCYPMVSGKGFNAVLENEKLVVAWSKVQADANKKTPSHFRRRRKSLRSRKNVGRSIETSTFRSTDSTMLRRRWWWRRPVNSTTDSRAETRSFCEQLCREWAWTEEVNILAFKSEILINFSFGKIPHLKTDACSQNELLTKTPLLA